MELREAIALADEAVFAKTGKHLDDIQVGMIEGVLSRQRYIEIAEALKCSEGYIKDVGYELWQIFSEAFGEEVNKSNLRSALLRKAMQNSSVNVFGDHNIGNGIIISSLNICSPPEESPEFVRGRQAAKKEMIAKLKALDLSDEKIAELLDLSPEDFSEESEA